MTELREKLDKHINLKNYTENHKNVTPKGNAKLMRICLIAGLAQKEKRTNDFLSLQMSSNSIHPTLFTVHNLNGILGSMIHLRYQHLALNWEDNITKSKVVNAEIFRGFDFLMQGENLINWLRVSTTASIKAGQIPFLNLKQAEHSIYRNKRGDLIILTAENHYLFLEYLNPIFEYQIPLTSKVMFETGNFIDIGEPLTEGIIDVHELLNILFNYHLIRDGLLSGTLRSLNKFNQIRF
jgi:hypothetical protein